MNGSANCPSLGKTLFVLIAPLVPGAVWADFPVDLRGLHSRINPDAYDLHTIINLACLAVFVLVFAAMLYSIWKHRRSADPKVAHFHASTAVEMVWTSIPFVILMLAAYPATRTNIEQDLAENQQAGVQRIAAAELVNMQDVHEKQYQR